MNNSLDSMVIMLGDDGLGTYIQIMHWNGFYGLLAENSFECGIWCGRDWDVGEKPILSEIELDKTLN